VIPAAEVGPENPLPVFRAAEDDRVIDFEAHGIPEEDRVGLGVGTGARVLPYRMQDGYTRKRTEVALPSIVLENEVLRVRVLPGVGGKVASIFHEPLQRELIYRNPVFQPGNLAIRNAWTSGGIEWNCGQVGHHYHTCAPVQCARIQGAEGEPALRMTVWERVKQFPYQIDLHLPPGSPFLWAHVRIINPHDHEIPMYWWTNIGMLEHDGGRVLAPADTTYHGLSVYDCPVINGIDYSYSTRVRRSYDLFFRIPQGHRPWEAYFDHAGEGFVHTSTARLRGRKQFAWGMGQGGRRWGDYLAVPDMPYLEIQAGLAYTQSHTVPMPGQTAWNWTEAMGHFAGDAERLHSENWQEAYGAAERVLEGMLPEAEVQRRHEAMTEIEGRKAEEVLFRGTGWAALERRRAGMVFEEREIGEEQGPWVKLLETGVFPERDPSEEPGQFMVQEEWRELLEESIACGKSDHWLAWLHLGVMKMEGGDTEGARAAWRTSVQRARNGWALRNLAQIELRAGNEKGAAELLAEAVRECAREDTRAHAGTRRAGRPHHALAGEYVALLLKLKRLEAAEELLGSLPAQVRRAERLQMAAGWVALHFDRFEEVEETLQQDFATVREGELTLSELWFGLQEKKLARAEGVEVDEALRARVRKEFPPPYEIDFRMTQEGDDKYLPPQDT
jgi:hypothetical protein